MHIVFDESNSLDPRKDICSINDNIGELMEERNPGENANKPLELEDPRKEEDEEIPQQNRVVERKNRNLVKMARTILHEYNLPLYF